MKKLVSFLALGAIVLGLIVFSSCSDKQTDTLVPQASASEITLTSSNTNSVVARSEEEMVDSIYADLISMFEQDDDDFDPAMVLQIAESMARALMGTPIYLSDYEVESLPAQQDPATSHATLTTPNGTFYFVKPSCICGYVVYEERYFPDENFQLLECGCYESLL